LSPLQTKHSLRSQSTNPDVNNNTGTKWLPHEKRLQKAWRGLGTTVATCLSKTEKAIIVNATPAANTQEKLKTERELDDCVALFLRTRREFHRLLSHVEAKIQGKAEEMESLETYVRTQPRIGKRKRLTK